MRQTDLELSADYFKPVGIPMRDLEVVVLTHEQAEAIRLCDMEDLEQRDAAEKMGVSRRTFARELHSARQKIATAIICGQAIKIKKEEK